MQKAIFLDRDGVINDPKDNYYVWKKEDFYFNEHIVKPLKKYQENGYIIIVISNQGGISKGEYKKEDTNKLHNYMCDIFEKHRLKITEIYYCPHHDSIEKCLCRKPDSLMLEKAIARFNIDAEKSIFIGDSERDIEAAEKVGVKGILIKKNAGFDFCVCL